VSAPTYPVEMFGRRMLLECLQEASASWWERRAVQFDRVGNERCDEIALACRNKASFLRMYEDDGLEDDLATVVAEIPARAQYRAAA
jgi:hypothetical protein